MQEKSIMDNPNEYITVMLRDADYIGENIKKIINILKDEFIVIEKKKTFLKNEFSVNKDLLNDISELSKKNLDTEKRIRNSIVDLTNEYKEIYFKVITIESKVINFKNSLSPYDIKAYNRKTPFQIISNLNSKINLIIESIKKLKESKAIDEITSIPTKIFAKLSLPPKPSDTNPQLKNIIIPLLERKELGKYNYTNIDMIKEEIAVYTQELKNYETNIEEVRKLINQFRELSSGKILKEEISLVKKINDLREDIEREFEQIYSNKNDIMFKAFNELLTYAMALREKKSL